MKDYSIKYMDDSFILEKLEALISEGNSLGNKLEKLTYLYEIKKYYPQGVKWRGTAINLLKLRFGKNSYYYQDFDEALDSVYTFDGGKNVKKCWCVRIYS